jgi:hypothetical protein
MAVCVAIYRLDYTKSSCWGFRHNLWGKNLCGETVDIRKYNDC